MDDPARSHPARDAGGSGRYIADMLEVLAEELTDLTRIVAKEQAREVQSRK